MSTFFKKVRPKLSYTTTKTGKRKRIKVNRLLEILINKRFYSILDYLKLKIFSYFSKVK